MCLQLLIRHYCTIYGTLVPDNDVFFGGQDVHLYTWVKYQSFERCRQYMLPSFDWLATLSASYDATLWLAMLRRMPPSLSWPDLNNHSQIFIQKPWPSSLAVDPSRSINSFFLRPYENYELQWINFIRTRLANATYRSLKMTSDECNIPWGDQDIASSTKFLRYFLSLFQS